MFLPGVAIDYGEVSCRLQVDERAASFADFMGIDACIKRCLD